MSCAGMLTGRYGTVQFPEQLEVTVTERSDRLVLETNLPPALAADFMQTFVRIAQNSGCPE